MMDLGVLLVTAIGMDLAFIAFLIVILVLAYVVYRRSR